VEGWTAPLIYCEVHGQFWHQRAAGLMKQCPGVAKNASTRLDRIRKGIHPTDKARRLTGNRPFAPPPSQRVEGTAQRPSMSPSFVQVSPVPPMQGRPATSSSGAGAPAFCGFLVQLSAADELHLASGELEEPPAERPEGSSDEEADPFGWGLSLD
jgi:hypothetical protein